MSSYVALYMFSYLSRICIHKCPLSICSSLQDHYINTHCFFFFNHTLLLCKAIVVTNKFPLLTKTRTTIMKKTTTTKQYTNGNLGASRLLRSYLTAEKKT